MIICDQPNTFSSLGGNYIELNKYSIRFLDLFFGRCYQLWCIKVTYSDAHFNIVSLPYISHMHYRVCFFHIKCMPTYAEMYY